MTRRSTTSGSPYESSIGFCRAVRVGQTIAVAGTGPIGPDGKTAVPSDAYGQTKRVLHIIAEAIASLDGALEDVIRTRMYLVNVEDWEAVGKAHGEVFGDIKPASTMVVVDRLIGDDWLIEIEADCLIDER